MRQQHLFWVYLYHWSSVFDQFPDLFLLYPAPFSL